MCVQAVPPRRLTRFVPAVVLLLSSCGGYGGGSMGMGAAPTPAINFTVQPSTIVAGQSATLTLSVDASAANSSYPITITGTEGTETHSTTVTLTVTEPVLNPGFELGDFKDWTRAGTTSISSNAHGGSYSGECGASTPTGDVSMLIQTFVLPTTATTLSVWYNMSCLGTVDVDWGGAKVKDDATGTIIYMLPNTCTVGQGWQEASADVSAWAGHEVTVTLYNHDDGDPSTPTYTLFDDVHVGY